MQILFITWRTGKSNECGLCRDDYDEKFNTTINTGDIIMRRKVMTMITVVLLVVGIISANVSAATISYNTMSRQYVISVTNDSDTAKTVYCRLIPSGGVASIQICNSTGTAILMSGIYPMNPINPNYITFVIPPHTTYTIYVNPIGGAHIWGNVEYGIS